MTNIQKEIDALSKKILKLEELKEKEDQEISAQQETTQAIHEILAEAGLNLESFIRFNIKTIKRIVTKIERESANKAIDKKPSVKKIATKKRRKKSARKKSTIKIPPGKYTNIPGTDQTEFVVKEKGPRPKLLKAYAENIGIEEFIKQCKVN